MYDNVVYVEVFLELNIESDIDFVLKININVFIKNGYFVLILVFMYFFFVVFIMFFGIDWV